MNFLKEFMLVKLRTRAELGTGHTFHHFLSQGFTLIELLVVVAIIGILASIVLVQFESPQRKATLAQKKQFASQISHALGADAMVVWSLDESLAPFKDSSGYGNNGNCSGSSCPVSVSDKSQCVFGTCLNFDGTDDSVDVGSTSQDPVYQYSLVGWVYPTVSPAASTPLIWRAHCDGISYNSSVVSASVKRADHSSDGVSISSSFLNLNEWNFVAATVSLETRELKLYVNRDSVSKELPAAWLSGGIPTQALITNNVRFGRESTVCIAPGIFSGKMDDIRIYKRAFTVAEIKQYYAATAPQYQRISFEDNGWHASVW